MRKRQHFAFVHYNINELLGKINPLIANTAYVVCPSVFSIVVQFSLPQHIFDLADLLLQPSQSACTLAVLLHQLTRAAFINILALRCGVYLRAAFIRGRRLFEEIRYVFVGLESLDVRYYFLSKALRGKRRLTS